MKNVNAIHLVIIGHKQNNMNNQITLTLEELQDILNAQKAQTAEHITRNLTIYTWFKFDGMDIDDTKEQLKRQCSQSGYPNDFIILKKYLKQ